jgi:hypothetical protein
VIRLCQKIPLPEALQEYIARKTEGCTPAQIQEVIYSLVVENPDEESYIGNFTEHDMDRIISKINGRKGQGIGFYSANRNNGKKPDSIATTQKV